MLLQTHTLREKDRVLFGLNSFLCWGNWSVFSRAEAWPLAYADRALPRLNGLRGLTRLHYTLLNHIDNFKSDTEYYILNWHGCRNCRKAVMLKDKGLRGTNPDFPSLLHWLFQCLDMSARQIWFKISVLLPLYRLHPLANELHLAEGAGHEASVVHIRLFPGLELELVACSGTILQAQSA